MVSRPVELKYERVAALRLTDFDWVDSLSRDISDRRSVASCQSETIALYRLWVASDRLADYVIAGGMNGVMVPAVHQGRAWFPTDSFGALRSAGRHDESGLSAFLRLMDQSKLRVYLSVDATVPLTAIERLIGQSPEMAEQLLRGDRNSGVQQGYRYNGLHPSVRNAVAELIGEVNQQAAGHSCYGGVALPVGRSSHVQSMGDESIDDSTLALLANSAANESISLAQLRGWVNDQGQSTFQEWKRSQTKQMYQTLSTKVAGKFLLLPTQPPGDVVVKSGEIHRSQSNPVAVRDVCRVVVGPLSRRIELQQSLPAADAPGSAAVGAEVVNLYDFMPANMPPTPVVRDATVKDIGRLIDRFDPAMLLVQSSPVTGGLSADLAQALAAFTMLPDLTMEKIACTDPAAQVVGVRSGTHNGYRLLTVTNYAPWSSEVDVECSPEVQWQLCDGSDVSQGESFAMRRNGSRTTVTLPGGRWIALKSKEPSPEGKIVSWTSRASGGDVSLDEIKMDVSAIVARLGILSDLRSYPVLSNGGFEQQGGVGLVGWLHAQHPADSVRVDEQESIEGKRSVLLTTDARYSNRTWLVSETFSPPESGRLAVSLACRGELSAGDSVHRLRVSIEGTRGGEPMRRSGEFTLPRDGKWQSREVVLEVDGIDPSTVESLRLTIDSLSIGRVWIDDVRLHDWFPLEKERRELQSQAFLAVQGLQRGNLTPSARLLQNHWAKYLLTEAASRQPPAVIDATETRDEAPGVAERIRSWLPHPLRF